MRGYKVPKDKSDDWWKAKANYISETNAGPFFEKLFFDDEDILLHVLIPTQLGLFLNKKRNEGTFKARKQIKSPEGKALILYQDTHLISCVICRTGLFLDQKKPYQVMLRIIAGGSGEEIRFEYIFQVLCRKCQSVPFHSLVYVDLYSNYNNFVAAMELCGGLSDMKKDNLFIPEVVSRLKSIFIPSFLYTVDPTLATCCYHCGKHDKKLTLCPDGCGTLYFCCEATNPKENTRSCLEFSRIYHPWGACAALSVERLFHMGCMLFVEADGKLEYCKNPGKDL